MSSLIKNVLLNIFLCLSSLACSQTDTDSVSQKTDTVSVTIVGSAEHPDPVLERVTSLERQGVLKNVVIMESFPVQIKLTGPADIVKELELIPRKK